MRRVACWVPSGNVENDDDCDDSRAVINPAAAERCNSLDDDCDGLIDDDDPDLPTGELRTWYDDADSDGYGDACDELLSCARPPGAVADDSDCDDDDASLNPGTSCEGAWDGSYAATVDIDVVVSSVGVTDTCSGTGMVDVDSTDAPGILGEMTCSFAGLAASLLPGPQDVALEGEMDSDTEASGDLLAADTISQAWTGAFTCPGTFTATASGTDSVSGVSYDYTVTIDASR